MQSKNVYVYGSAKYNSTALDHETSETSISDVTPNYKTNTHFV
jgi:hypothetical protein